MKKKAKTYGIIAIGFYIVWIILTLFVRFVVSKTPAEPIAIMLMSIIVALVFVSIPSGVFFTILAVYMQFKHTKPEIKKVEMPVRDAGKQQEITFKDVKKINDKISNWDKEGYDTNELKDKIDYIYLKEKGHSNNFDDKLFSNSYQGKNLKSMSNLGKILLWISVSSIVAILFILFLITQ